MDFQNPEDQQPQLMNFQSYTDEQLKQEAESTTLRLHYIEQENKKRSEQRVTQALAELKEFLKSQGEWKSLIQKMQNEDPFDPLKNFTLFLEPPPPFSLEPPPPFSLESPTEFSAAWTIPPPT